MTAWYGLNPHIMHPKAGETVLVSAASRAVGSVVGQLAKLQGCRVIGIAGGAEKCKYVVNELGFDACIDYKAEDWQQQLTVATPQGLDAILKMLVVKSLMLVFCMNRFWSNCPLRHDRWLRNC